MLPRSPHEPHRTATPLELFFDLVFVVAIAQASAGLHHAASEDHLAAGLLAFVMAFFGIWWAWMNFTWFASAYDCDDIPYRLLVFVQMTGALIFTAGLQAMGAGDLRLGVAGYVVMRLAMVTQWLRAAHGDPARRATALRYASGIAAVQLLWVGMLAVPPAWVVPGFFALVALELLVPVWAERAGGTPWHPHHIVERYGLMTIIVLGESVLAATLATERALAAGQAFGPLVPVVAGGILTMYAMWWLYFDHAWHEELTSFGRTFAWGYGHVLVFAAAAMAGAAIAVAVDQVTGDSRLDPRAAGALLAWPVAVYLGMLWFLHGHARARDDRRTVGRALALAALVGAPFTPEPVLATGATLVLVLAATLQGRRRPAEFSA